MSGHVTEFHNEPNSGRLWIYLILIMGGVLVSVVAGSMIFRAAAASYFDGMQDRGGLSYELTTLRRAESQALTTLKWIDREKGVIQLPIEQAKARVLQRYQP